MTQQMNFDNNSKQINTNKFLVGGQRSRGLLSLLNVLLTLGMEFIVMISLVSLSCSERKGNMGNSTQLVIVPSKNKMY